MILAYVLIPAVCNDNQIYSDGSIMSFQALIEDKRKTKSAKGSFTQL